MDLRVGMYVRTNYRKEKVIRKILNIVEDSLVHDHYLIFDKPTKYTYYVEDNNYTAKENLIELIKVGDYVNGQFVIQTSKETGLIFTEPTYYDERRGEELHYCYFEHEIESIVTKEQFKSMEYEVMKNG